LTAARLDETLRQRRATTINAREVPPWSMHPVPLKLDTLRRSYRAELLPTA
jgi:hypothetical protein